MIDEWQEGDSFVVDDVLFTIEKMNVKVAKAYNEHLIHCHETDEVFPMHSYKLSLYRKLTEEEKAFYLLNL